MKLYYNPRVNKYEKLNNSQDIESDHRIDSDSDPKRDPIGYYIISIKPMKSYGHPSHGMRFETITLETYKILVSELHGIQCSVVTDSIGGFKE